MLYYFNTATAIKNSALFHLLPCQCAPCDWLKPFLEPLLARQELLLVVVLEEAAVALPPRRSQVYWQPTAPSPSRIVHDGLLLALYDFQQHDGRTDACANYFGYDTASTIVHCTTTNRHPATYWAILRQSLSKWRTPRCSSDDENDNVQDSLVRVVVVLDHLPSPSHRCWCCFTCFVHLITTVLCTTLYTVTEFLYVHKQ